MRSGGSSHWRDFELEDAGSEAGQCDCCGTSTTRHWGFIRRNGQPVGAYFVAFAHGRPDHGAKFDLILGNWGHTASRADRYALAVDMRVIDGAPAFMVVDAVDRITSGSPLVGTALMRTDVIGTPLAPQAFAIIDAVYMSDVVAELRRWSAD